MVHTRGDKPASYEKRELPSAHPMIRNRLLGVINLPATIHASYDSHVLRNVRPVNAGPPRPPHPNVEARNDASYDCLGLSPKNASNSTHELRCTRAMVSSFPLPLMC